MSSDIYAVRFVLDGQIHHAQGERRTTTVLDYLRDKLHRTGTKEGCAEGDCGACVVLVGEPGRRRAAIAWKPVNACMQMLPTLDGKAVKTVESLQRADGNLHPAQGPWSRCHGTQCGFCTPGIVMSLAAWVSSRAARRPRGADHRRAGRQPVPLHRLPPHRRRRAAGLRGAGRRALAAGCHRAGAAEGDRPPGQPSYNLDGELVVQPVVRTRKGSEFVSPATLAELSAYLAEHPDATLLAGSTEFGLAVNKRYERPAYIAYVGGMAALQAHRRTGADWRIGAAVPLDRVHGAGARRPARLRRGAAPLRLSPPIRATATLGGNIANGSPIGDSMPCLLALGATLVLRRRGARARTRPAASSWRPSTPGQKRNVLQPGEFIEAIELPRPGPPALPRAQDQQALRAGHLGHLRAMSWRDDGGRAARRAPGLQRPHAVPGARA
jgi:xanthine dehydrogenase small subunit